MYKNNPNIPSYGQSTKTWYSQAWARIKERVRKTIVTLKHKPHLIPLIMLVITFLYYALNLTTISDTTAKIQGPNMGLCGFVIMLFSILSMVCFNNAFPHRKPVNKPMLILMFLMFAVILTADTLYMNAIWAAIDRAESPITITQDTIYIARAFNDVLPTHRILLIVSPALIVLLPVYSKWIRKIDTSIEVEAGSEDIGTIDISGED